MHICTCVCMYLCMYVCIITRHPLPGLVRVQSGKLAERQQQNTCVADGSSPTLSVAHTRVVKFVIVKIILFCVFCYFILL